MVKIIPKEPSTNVTVPKSIPFIIELTLPKLTDLKDKRKVIQSEKLAVWKSQWCLQVDTSLEKEVDGEIKKYVTVGLHMEYLYPQELCRGYQVQCKYR